tara:strand:+ start:1015 stop:1662 length:648 start_codon:yes stop_codon:yes gene_type:complete
MLPRIFAAVLSVACLMQAHGGTLQENRWDQAGVRPSQQRKVAKVVDRIMRNIDRYKLVDSKTNVPWYVLSGLHNMESSGSFRHHLHEGSPLYGRTKCFPKGRPKTGSPPFTWEESAIDAITYDKLGKVDWGQLDDTLYACERYNGTGYLRYHKSTPSPYLWATTTIEKPGKYISDGKWSSTARSKQVGVAAIFKEMEKRGIVDFGRLTRTVIKKM